MNIERRPLLLGLASLMSAGQSRLALANGPAGDKRLVIVLLRGAMDGLSAVPAYGDPDFRALRGALALPEPGQEGGVLDLGGRFGMHPALPKLHALFKANQAMVVHAVAGPWRSRSHFEAQDMLESGAAQRLHDGWLNRAIATMPAEAQGGAARRGIAIGPDLPLMMRGPARVGSYAALADSEADTQTLALLARWHAGDAQLGPAFAEGLRARGFSTAVLAGQEPPPRGTNGFVALAGAAGRLLADPRGPRIAAMETGGWDTHGSQAVRIAAALRTLDDGLDALRLGLGPAWADTAILVMTEFGRTARINGTMGTDHGTAGAAFLLGGAVRGGRVLADWPGLSPQRLFENRDLAPTLDLRRVAKGLLSEHLGLGGPALRRSFPASDDAPPLPGLVGG
ncbi:DUF1501 domain-containing protein [Roseococcus sp. SYP-B2431]|uniref:DUF1501 domain-containing protein n=1 Tax=Roseococcus sp. SYP-B2431 TaxID=2496640 RepID=UPI0010397878|nr:DUF1501 domain-containing protein [Roseococcus sp. SYP-B2431]TCH97563.1 DUF1501 domain-containing protein [Roseococcus sp. SYP-B2431]